MRLVLFPLIILMLTAGIALAENKQDTEKLRQGFSKERVVRIKSGKYSRMLMSMLRKTSRLDLSKQQDNKIKEIRTKYISPMVTQEGESSDLQRKFMLQLHKSDFNPAELKTIMKETDVVNEKITNMFIDAMAVLRDVVGPENYAKMTPVSRIDRNTLIQLRKEELARTQKLKAQENAKTQSDSKSDKSK
jgi:hypothetical protein